MFKIYQLLSARRSFSGTFVFGQMKGSFHLAADTGIVATCK
jgi:hypothetical protein